MVSSGISMITSPMGGQDQPMRADILNSFLQGAIVTLEAETKSKVLRTGLRIDPAESISDEVTILVSLVGQLRGMVMVGMSTDTARQVASAMIGEQLRELTEMGLSALAELGNLIAGKSMGELESAGLTCDITPPTIMLGQRTRISTLGLPRFVIPLECGTGNINIHVAADEIR